MVKKLVDRSYADFIRTLYPWDREFDKEESRCRNVTFQVTDDCPLKCTYCYQGHKGHRMMSKDVAKRGVDLLFEMYDRNEGTFINHGTKAIILDFIGGEPLMNIDVIDYICEYFVSECLRRNHPWLYTWRASMISNGVLYFDPKVQKFFKKFKGFVSFGVTIDGPKEIHDTCRVHHDGRGSFDEAFAAMMHYRENYSSADDTKVTIAPENLKDINKIVKFFRDLDIKLIHANCAFEPEWNEEHAKIFYRELKTMADYLLELNDETYVSLFKEDTFEPLSHEDNNNWCWIAGTPILTVDGYKPIEEIEVGDMVYTEDGTIHPVINTMSHFADNVVMITTGFSNSMGCTTNHKLYAIHDGEYGTYEIQTLNDTDLIKTATRTLDGDILFGWTSGLTLTPAPDQMVYNITVDTNHSYIAGGLSSSNCGGTGAMLAFDPDGVAYPCLRYMPSSLGPGVRPLICGSVDGIFEEPEHKALKEYLDGITRRSQSTDECWDCPIAKGCAWCSGWNYQLLGTPNARCTRICVMHKARSLANVYYWNKWYQQQGEDKKMKMWLPKEEALKIIDEDEYNILLELSE